MDRNLDGIYFRIKREKHFEDVCFSDLAESEQAKLLDGKSSEWLKFTCIHLAERLKYVGDTFDITTE